MAGTSNITNLYLYNRYINDVDDDPTADISDLESLRVIIDQTCDLIEKKCGRIFGSATYKEWVRGDATTSLIVNNYPITAIKLISGCAIDSFTVQNTGNSYATVSCDSTGFTITSMDSSAVEITNTFAYATYTNVTDLVAAINLIAGWSAEVLGSEGNKLTQLIRPISSAWCLDEKVYVRTPYLGGSVRATYDTNGVLESSCGNEFFGDIFVWYVAGYTLPVCDESGGTLTITGNVPEGLTQIANQIIKEIVSYKDEDGNMQTENIGDYSYSRHSITSVIDRHWKDLSLYARKSI